MRLPCAGLDELSNIDQRLRAILAQQTDAQPVLGLLPVPGRLQDSAKEALKKVIGSSFQKLLQCLEVMPCVTAYVLAIGPGSSMDGLKFYEP
jgi:hypothetical protein